MSPPEFDRSKPAFRLFEMEDGSRQWFPVLADNTPGQPLAPEMAEMVQAYVNQSEWADAFYAAFIKHRKATVYGRAIPPVIVPEGCDGVLTGARITTWGAHKIAIGHIHGDRKGRWVDGHPIHTSNIISGPDADGVIRTLNSVYKLVMAQ